ncbi:tRNA synthetases class I (M)-domain-containing protein [Kalaharituber pfeilii]|nr:tRNA synthetases class I (M)-domain-containing protein [Kalaharituber pfeilii]
MAQIQLHFAFARSQFLSRCISPLRFPISSKNAAWFRFHRPFSTGVPHISTIATPEKPYYITTPIFYVNAAPHVGHLYTLVLTDVIKRWQQLLGNHAIMATGTDEHGMKIQQAAHTAKQHPKDFCDAAAENLALEANISNDHFIRTTDPIHYDAVQYAWHMLNAAGYIYTAKHEGWYSVSDETFFPESSVEPRIDPQTGRKDMYSIETGKVVEFTSESNYHFRLSAFQDRLISLYQEENPSFVLPSVRHQYILSQLTSQPLADLSISRPRERLTWGIPVPHDADHTIYVWLDALINYLTVAGYPFTPGLEHANGWPADVHVIGKDILRFHCIYWPAFLMALELPLPKNIVTHAHWTMNKRKMSKSVGNVVNPSFALSRFGVDTLRYYLVHDGGMVDDGDYANEMVIERYSKHLQGQLGNLLSRVSSKKFSGTTLTILGNEQQGDWVFDSLDLAQLSHLNAASEKSTRCMSSEQYDVCNALKEIMSIIFETNKYITHTAPWKLASSSKAIAAEGGDTRAVENNIHKVIYLCAEGLRIAGIMLQPFMPTKAAELLDGLGVQHQRRGIQWTRVGVDAEYGRSLKVFGKGGLFPPLESYE